MTNTTYRDTKTHPWTVDEIEARRATCDSLVTVGDWSVSFCSDSHGVRLSMRRVEAVTYHELDLGEGHGHLFATTDDAECHALNAGALQWYRDAQEEEDARLAAEVTDEEIWALGAHASVADGRGEKVTHRGDGRRYAVAYLVHIAKAALAYRYSWARAGAARAIRDLGL